MSETFLSVKIAGEEFLLLPQKAFYRPSIRQLIISDVHLGKTTHFRKAGIAMPQQGQLRDIDKLAYLLRMFEPQSVLFLGDLFHSSYNREWLHFKALLTEYPKIGFILIEGNHDILQDEHYTMPNLATTERMEEDHLIFTHHPIEDPAKLNICGHIHPGVLIGGKAKQYVKLPCFYRSETHFILPAFGSLTGLYLLDKVKEHEYYVVYNDLVRKI